MILAKRLIFSVLATAMVASPVLPFGTAAQTEIKPAKSCATPQQDVQLGQQAAAQAEKQFEVLRDQRTQDYIRRLGERLARSAPPSPFQFSFKVLNVAEINAFALPGGPTYVNRGTIEAAKNEAELAGVMAHEISHVILRHGTANVCRAQKAQGWAGVLGAVLGNSAWGQLAQLGTQIGAGSILLRNSREAESDADVLGSQIMARAGYNPIAMADFFETLADQQKGDAGRLARWFSDHPQPKDRRDRIKREADLIGYRGNGTEVGGFRDVRGTLNGMAKAPSMSNPNSTGGGSSQPGRPADFKVDPPSQNLAVFRHNTGIYEIAYPSNWQAAEGNTSIGATLYPNGGASQDGIAYGVIIDSYLSQTQVRKAASLDAATREIIDNTIKGNTYLRVVSGPSSATSVSGRQSMMATLEGRSPLTNRDERVVLYNIQLKGGDTMYILFVTPRDEYSGYQAIFRKMIQSIRITD